MPQVIGIDPSLRHTGLCVYWNAESYAFTEIKPLEVDILSAVQTLKKEFKERVGCHLITPGTVIAIEKQLSVGGHSSSLLFFVQMAIYQSIIEVCGDKYPIPTIIAPLPIQLISYIKKQGIDTTSAGTIVKGFQKQTGYDKRVSQHCVDGYYLARLAKDVLEGRFKYKLPQKETPLIPWSIVHDCGLDK